MNTLVIDLSGFDAFLLDVDGVITRTGSLHASAWKSRFVPK
jgi:beta-phosphoglucomutase-like phosphatase (HAD superfamily)